jgi:hypothetical protein
VAERGVGAGYHASGGFEDRGIPQMRLVELADVDPTFVQAQRQAEAQVAVPRLWERSVGTRSRV